MLFQSTWLEKGSAGLTVKAFKDILKVNLMKTALMWHTLFFPKRFEAAGQYQYHLRPRGWRYVKARKKHDPDWRPLVLTGELRDRASQSYRPVGVAKGTRIEARMKMQRGHATARYVSQEVVRTNKNEIEYLQKAFKKHTLEELKSAKSHNIQKI